MGWTKRQFIQQAFEEIGLAAYVYDLTSEQLDSALRRMDAMVAGWNANGVRIGYPLPNSPQNSRLDDDSGVPDYCNEAIYLGLAVRIAPSFGKTLSVQTLSGADMAYSNMANQVAYPVVERQLPNTMPRGQGSKPWRNYNNPFISQAQEAITTGSDNHDLLES